MVVNDSLVLRNLNRWSDAESLVVFEVLRASWDANSATKSVEALLAVWDEVSHVVDRAWLVVVVSDALQLVSEVIQNVGVRLDADWALRDKTDRAVLIASSISGSIDGDSAESGWALLDSDDLVDDLTLGSGVDLGALGEDSGSDLWNHIKASLEVVVDGGSVSWVGARGDVRGGAGLDDPVDSLVGHCLSDGVAQISGCWEQVVQDASFQVILHESLVVKPSEPRKLITPVGGGSLSVHVVGADSQDKH